MWLACKKSKNNGPDPVIPRGMSAKINGVQWTADLSTLSYMSFGDYVVLTAYDTSGKTIEFRIDHFKNRGSYTVPQTNDSIFYSATGYGLLSSGLAATAGNITIQAVNDTAVGGTFNFTADTVVVTDGSFYMNYQ